MKIGIAITDNESYEFGEDNFTLIHNGKTFEFLSDTDLKILDFRRNQIKENNLIIVQDVDYGIFMFTKVCAFGYIYEMVI